MGAHAGPGGGPARPPGVWAWLAARVSKNMKAEGPLWDVNCAFVRLCVYDTQQRYPPSLPPLSTRARLRLPPPSPFSLGWSLQSPFPAPSQISMPQLRLAHDYVEAQGRLLQQLAAARGGDVEVQVGVWTNVCGGEGGRQGWRG